MPSLLNLKYSLRSLKNNKFSLFINIFGFAVSLAFVIMIGLYVQKEYSVDDFQKYKDRIFVLEAPMPYGAGINFPYPLMNDLLSNFPQIESGARVTMRPLVTSFPDGNKVNVSVMIADKELFDILTFEFIDGEPFRTSDGVVLSESFARANFGEQSPIGQVIRVDDVALNISGVIKDVENSHISDVSIIADAGFLINREPTLKYYNQWGWLFYLKGTAGSNLEEIEEEINGYMKENTPGFSDFIIGDVSLRPILDIYFAPYSSYALSFIPFIRHNDPGFIAVMLTVAVIILAFAGINYLNLSVAQSGFRAKSTAIQRLLGSPKREVFWSFIAESVSVLAVSGVLAFLIARLAFPWFGSLMLMRMSFTGELSWLNVLVIALIVLVMGTIAGWAPAAVISGFKPIEVTRGTFRRKTKSVYSKILITFQYTITIVLLGCSAVIIQQVNFMKNSDKGFDSDNLIVFTYHEQVMPESSAPLINNLKKIPGVVDAVGCIRYPMAKLANNSTFPDKDGVSQSHTVIYADSAFISLLDLKVKSVNSYHPDGHWVNETAAKRLGIDENTLEYSNAYPKQYMSFKVKGILKDFHFTDFTSPIGSLEIMPFPKDWTPMDMLVKVSGTNRAETFRQVRDTYNQMAGGDLFDGVFMSDIIASYYNTEDRLSNMLSLLSFVAIVISSMGMLAMSIYFTRQRARDMAVRKVFGATPKGVLWLLMSGFMKHVLVAFVIAVPVIYLIMCEWLSSYVYRIDITPVPFVIAGGIVLVIAVLTVIGYSLKVAYSNPVDSLKTE